MNWTHVWTSSSCLLGCGQTRTPSQVNVSAGEWLHGGPASNRKHQDRSRTQLKAFLRQTEAVCWFIFTRSLLLLSPILRAFSNLLLLWWWGLWKAWKLSLWLAIPPGICDLVCQQRVWSTENRLPEHCGPCTFGQLDRHKGTAWPTRPLPKMQRGLWQLLPIPELFTAKTVAQGCLWKIDVREDQWPIFQISPFKIRIKLSYWSCVLRGENEGCYSCRALGQMFFILFPFLWSCFPLKLFQSFSSVRRVSRETIKRYLDKGATSDGSRACRRAAASSVLKLGGASWVLSATSVEGNKQRRLSTGENTNSKKQKVLFFGCFLFLYIDECMISIADKKSSIDFLSEPAKAELWNQLNLTLIQQRFTE